MKTKKMTPMKSILGPATKPKPPAAKKAPAKKKTTTRVVNEPVEAMPYREPKTVRITAAANGMTVSSYGPKGEILKVAKDMSEAMQHCKEMMK